MARGRVSQLVNQSTDLLLLLRLVVDVDCCLAVIVVVVATCAAMSSFVDGGNATRENFTDNATDKQTKNGSQKDHNNVCLLLPLLPCRIIVFMAAAASNKGGNKRQQQQQTTKRLGHNRLRTLWVCWCGENTVCDRVVAHDQ